MFSRIQLVALTLAVTAFQVLAQVPTDCARGYTVVVNDTCDGISAANNASTFQLAHVNTNINADCTNLFAGEHLCLGITGQDCQNIAVVESGDFCALIAEDAGIDVSTLLANNPNVNSDCSNIYVGEVLCTASTIIPYTS